MLSKLVAVDGLSFNQIANCVLLRRAFKSDGYTLPKSPQNVRNQFMTRYGKTIIIEQGIRKIQEEGGHFSISFDESTLVRYCRYMNLNLLGWKEVSFALGPLKMDLNGTLLSRNFHATI